MNRIYKWDNSDLSPTQKKFLNFHKHHIYCKHLKVDFIPKEHERTILILAENFGKVHKETIELIPFNYILIVDPFFDKYNCSIINEKKVIQIPLEPVIFLQIAQDKGLGIKIDSLFLSNDNSSLFDFLLEMCYPLMKEEFEYKQFDMFCFMCKTKESKSYTINGKKVTIVHGSGNFWDDIDTSLEVHFTTFCDEWSEYLIRLYQQDLYDRNGLYLSEEDIEYNLTNLEHLNELLNRCEYKIVGFTLNPRIYEQIFQILMSENQVQEIFIYGFLEEGNTI